MIASQDFLFFGLLWSFLIGQINLQESLPIDLKSKLSCVDAATCGQCLSAAPHCAWCADPTFDTYHTPRCFDERSLAAANCSQSSIQTRPIAETLIVQNEEPNDWTPDKKAVQLSPQMIKVQLNPMEPKKVKLKYRPARNYPLDLYFLMDMTISMEDDKDTLVSLSDLIPKAIRNLTNNFRVGFGAYIEKPLSPFVDFVHPENPCANIPSHNKCDPVYSFKHYLSLTDQVTDFIAKVNSSSVSANLDDAENGLEALLQVAVCKEQIGWRDDARKIVIILTDGIMHQAGDGKLVGLVKPHDGKCYLAENGSYTASVTFDYPSYSQLERILRLNKVNVIFAVTENVKPYYDPISSVWGDSTFVGELEKNGSNILSLIKKGYEGLTSVIDLIVDQTSGPEIDVSITSTCKSTGDHGGGHCEDVEYGETYEFELEMVMKKCPSYQNGMKSTIVVQETKLSQDNMVVEMELLCGCECTSNDEYADVMNCPENSVVVCGQCQCTEDWSGPNCDCHVSHSGITTDIAACQDNSSLTSEEGLIPPLCSGAGDCLCGSCHCDRGFYGKYCQCSPCPVSRISRSECGGADRGECVCGTCSCKEGWSGRTCDCSTDQSNCVSSIDRGKDDPPMCSGRGSCKCGECMCEGTARGEWCESCTDCNNPICDVSNDCVACTMLRQVDCEKFCRKKPVFSVTVDLSGNSTIPRHSLTWCLTQYERDDRLCKASFAYGKDVPVNSADVSKYPTAIPLVVLDEYCQPPRAAALFWGGLTISIIVIVIGLIVAVVVKITTMIAERRDFLKYQIDLDKNSKFKTENPLYIPPITMFKVPDEIRSKVE